MRKETLIKKQFQKLSWYALMPALNGNKLVPFNILREDLLNNILKLLKNNPKYKYEDIKEIIRRWACYHYWCKFEYEFDVYTLFGDRIQKTSVWEQIEPNLDRLTEYIKTELML
jgi:hypothetical protein